MPQNETVEALPTTLLIPDRVNRRWMDLLDNIQLADAESTLHRDFTRLDRAEKLRRGTQYRLLEGPAPLIDAWIRWRLVNNEARDRSIPTHHRG
jgi:hypothetical protein